MTQEKASPSIYDSANKFAEELLAQTEPMPEDIAAIIDKEFWNMI